MPAPLPAPAPRAPTPLLPPDCIITFPCMQSFPCMPCHAMPCHAMHAKGLPTRGPRHVRRSRVWSSPCAGHFVWCWPRGAGHRLFGFCPAFGCGLSRRCPACVHGCAHGCVLCPSQAGGRVPGPDEQADRRVLRLLAGRRPAPRRLPRGGPPPSSLRALLTPCRLCRPCRGRRPLHRPPRPSSSSVSASSSASNCFKSLPQPRRSEMGSS